MSVFTGVKANLYASMRPYGVKFIKWQPVEKSWQLHPTHAGGNRTCA